MISRAKAGWRNGCRVGLYSVSSGRDMVGAAYCHPHVKHVEVREQSRSAELSQ